MMKYRHIATIGVCWSAADQVVNRLLDRPTSPIPAILFVTALSLMAIYGVSAVFDRLSPRMRSWFV
jgi:hypothetical protein